jgi:hypothetical protein
MFLSPRKERKNLKERLSYLLSTGCMFTDRSRETLNSPVPG